MSLITGIQNPEEAMVRMSRAMMIETQSEHEAKLQKWCQEKQGTAEYANRLIAADKIRVAMIFSHPDLDLSNLQLTTLAPVIDSLSRLETIKLEGNNFQLNPMQDPVQRDRLKHIRNVIFSNSSSSVRREAPAAAKVAETTGKVSTPFERGLQAWCDKKKGTPEYAQRCIAMDLIRDCKSRNWRGALDLSNLGLTELPPEIGQLTSIRTLYLNGNKLKQLPQEICNLKNLDHLALNDNCLEIIPQEMSYFTTREFFDLRNNLSLPNNPPLVPEAIGKNRLFDNRKQAQDAGASTGDAFGTIKEIKPIERGVLAMFQRGLQAWCLEKSSDKTEYLNRCIARDKIVQCYSSHSDTLDLSNLKLTTLPLNEINEMTSLKTLKIHGNNLKSKPEFCRPLLN